MKTAVWQNIENAAHLKVLMEGSGDPADEHEILGVAVFTSDGNLLIGMGEIKGEDESDGQIPEGLKKAAPDLVTFAAGFLRSFREDPYFAPERLCHAVAGTYDINITWEEADQLLADSFKI